jgi:Cof subfamily protein (haloacid dehalogenase superfamily)
VDLPYFTGRPRAVAIDLDGTLLNTRTHVSDRSRRAVTACLEAGIPVIIATSRPWRTTARVLGPDLVERCSLVLENGAVVRAAPPLSGDRKWEIPPDVLDEALSLLQSVQPDLGLTLEIEGREFGGNVVRTPDELWERNAAMPEMYLTLEEAKAHRPSKIAASARGNDLRHVVTALEQRLGKALSILPANGDTFLNITARGVTKTAAIQRLVASAGWTLADVLAIGDDIPDVEMLRACGTAVTMANACAEVIAIADCTTLSNDEDGVAVVLERLLEA